MSFQGVAPILFESVSAVTASPSVDVGTIRSYNSERYTYVYNAGNSQISTAKGVTVSAVSGFSVTVSSVSGDFCMGFVKHATMATATYGWVLTVGCIDSALNGMASTAIAAGDVLQLAADGAIAKGVTGHNVGKAVTATGSAGVASLFVELY